MIISNIRTHAVEKSKLKVSKWHETIPGSNADISQYGTGEVCTQGRIVPGTEDDAGIHSERRTVIRSLYSMTLPRKAFSSLPTSA